MIHVSPLTAVDFAPYGDVIEMAAEPSFLINNGKCGRYHDLAKLDFLDGAANISLAYGQPYALPLNVPMMERHPLGSQAFIPLNDAPFLVIVASDLDGAPTDPRAFLSNGAQGVNYHRNTWHGVLTPLENPQPFVIVDWKGKGVNLEEHHFDTPFSVVP